MTGLLPRLPMPGIPPKPPRPNGDWAGSGGGAPLFPLLRKMLLLNVVGWDGHLVGAAGAGVGDGAAGAGAAAPPCFITR